MTRRRSALAIAIEMKEWELASLILLLGITKAARGIPPETLEEMLTLLTEEAPRRRRTRKPRRGQA